MLMKKILMLMLCLGLISPLATNAADGQPTETTVAENFIIVVGQYPAKSNADDLLKKMKPNYKDAGVFYDDAEKKYYVYIETYYSKSGADYAVWWMKKNRPTLPIVWAKTIAVK
tara:strand:- start:178001 stop:178342 length:342 start_codon:yes stop_codon:yes gene_type:complete